MTPAPCALAAGAVALAFAMEMAADAHTRHHRCPDCDIPFEWDDGAALPPEVGPYPQGFALTVPIVPGQATGDRPASLDRYAEVALAIGQCWAPMLTPDESRWRDLTLRVSFKRDGTVYGAPRIAHISDPADDQAQRSGRQSLIDALRRCTPLPLSPSLGRAIAGQIFAIRFVQQRKS